MKSFIITLLTFFAINIGISAQDELDQSPKYPGGMTGMKLFLMENIHYPTDAQDNGVEGRVFVGFVIDKDGTVTDAKVMRIESKDPKKPLPKSCEDEAVRVVMAMPKWEPGIKDGVPVKVRYTLPIGFYMSLPDIK